MYSLRLIYTTGYRFRGPRPLTILEVYRYYSFLWYQVPGMIHTFPKVHTYQLETSMYYDVLGTRGTYVGQEVVLSRHETVHSNQQRIRRNGVTTREVNQEEQLSRLMR
jgi:hypothetical protein